jgi:hypothetical protein
MHSDYNQFLHSVNFEVNSFNVGTQYEHAYRMLIKYADWFESFEQNYAHILSKEQFENIIDQLYMHELNQPSRLAYKHLKENNDHPYSIDLLSLFKLYLLLKVRRYQISNQDSDLTEVENGLANLFLPLQRTEKEKSELNIQQTLPDFSVVNSTGALLPLSLLIANVAIMKITPTTTLSFILHIGVFLIVAGLFTNVLKKTKSKDDQAMLMAWGYIIENNLNHKKIE